MHIFFPGKEKQHIIPFSLNFDHNFVFITAVKFVRLCTEQVLDSVNRVVIKGIILCQIHQVLHICKNDYGLVKIRLHYRVALGNPFAGVFHLIHRTKIFC